MSAVLDWIRVNLPAIGLCLGGTVVGVLVQGFGERCSAPRRKALERNRQRADQWTR